MNTSAISRLSFLSMAMIVSTEGTTYAQAPGQTHSPAELVDALHSAFGSHHSRAVHAKGIILQGDFVPDPQAAKLTTAFHLQRTPSHVTVRFSDFTGIPDIPDNIGAANPRGLAIRFELPDGRSTDIVGHSFNGFPTPTSDQFRELLLAIGASGPGTPPPTALDSFLHWHPVAKTFLTTQKLPGSYGAISYFGVNAFRFTNSGGHQSIIRYQFIPVDGEELLSTDAMAKKDADFLVKEIQERVKSRAVTFRVLAQVAEDQDNPDDPSTAWPNSRKLIPLGMLSIRGVAPNTVSEDKALAFNPLNLPTGIEPADPMLTFRGKAYPVSVKERQ
jgi:catalase